MNPRSQLFPVVLLGAAAVAALVLGQVVATQSPVVPLAVVASLAVGFLTLVRPDLSLLVLVFSMLLSPEIPIAELPKRLVVVRADDILLLTISLVWMVKSAVGKGLGFFVETPLNRPILAYTLVCIIATLKGVLFGDVPPVRASFYLLKYIEYFLLYILVSNLLVDRRHLRRCLWAGAVTALVVAVYAYAHIGKVPRLYAPFDYEKGNVGEPATLGGYLLIVMSLCFGFFTQISSIQASAPAILFAAFLVPPFVLTLSRASYVGIVASALAVLFRTRRKRILFFGLLALGGLLMPVFAPGLVEALADRIRATFVFPASSVEVGGYRIGLESSAAERVTSWSRVFTYWLPRRPLLGHGITGVGLVDAQIPLVLGETGLLGFAAFAWLLWTLYVNARRAYQSADSEFDRGLTLGFLALLAGLLVQSLTTNTFIIVRIMEPFWFLAAAVMRLPHLPPDDGGPAPARAAAAR